MIKVKLEKIKIFIEQRYEKLFQEVDFSYYTDFNVIEMDDIDLNDCIIETEVNILKDNYPHLIQLIENGADEINMPIDAIIYIRWVGYFALQSKTWKSKEISINALLRWNNSQLDWNIIHVTEIIDDPDF